MLSDHVENDSTNFILHSIRAEADNVTSELHTRVGRSSKNDVYRQDCEVEHMS